MLDSYGSELPDKVKAILQRHRGIHAINSKLPGLKKVMKGEPEFKDCTAKLKIKGRLAGSTRIGMGSQKASPEEQELLHDEQATILSPKRDSHK